MEVLTEEELAARLDFRRPLKDATEERESIWCIPFEWGSNVKGTKISIAKAKEIAAELRREIAESELRQLRHYFQRETERAAELGRQSSEEREKVFTLQGEVAQLKRQLRAKKSRAGHKH